MMCELRIKDNILVSTISVNRSSVLLVDSVVAAPFRVPSSACPIDAFRHAGRDLRSA